MINKLNRAFTLLEILVVIGIIGILIGLGAVSYSTAQKKARDARRQSDLSSFQKTMEQCYSVNSYVYPTTGSGLTVTDGEIEVICPAPNNSITITISDPLNSAPYVYALTSSESEYTLVADLETSTTDAQVSQQQ